MFSESWEFATLPWITIYWFHSLWFESRTFHVVFIHLGFKTRHWSLPFSVVNRLWSANTFVVWLYYRSLKDRCIHQYLINLDTYNNIHWVQARKGTNSWIKFQWVDPPRPSRWAEPAPLFILLGNRFKSSSVFAVFPSLQPHVMRKTEKTMRGE